MYDGVVADRIGLHHTVGIGATTVQPAVDESQGP